MHILLVVLVSLLFSISVYGQRNLVLVTIDGLRWQEVFRGADPNLIKHKEYVKKPNKLSKTFWDDSTAKRRKLLMPFMWEILVKQGSIIGDRHNASLMSLQNNWYFSYPGYSEILTGIADDRINSNRKFPNPNVSFLEWLNTKPEFANKVAAFGSWDVFPFILNSKRSGLPVNAGFMPAKGYNTGSDMPFLNRLQSEIPSPWDSVRLDAFTHHFALDYLAQDRPRVLYIAYGETDDFAHDGRYDHYLHATKRTDHFIRQLWQFIQSEPDYANQTNLIITTDHGRGSTENDWQHHASQRSLNGYMKSLSHFEQGIVGSNHVWLAALGPDIAAKGLIKTATEIKTNQVAATALVSLGQDYLAFNPNIGSPISQLFKNQSILPEAE